MKWEYKAIEPTKTGILTDFLNDFGEIGWELIHCEIDANLFIFKRPLPELKPEDKQAIEGYIGGKIA